MTWVLSLHPCFPLSLSSSFSHDMLSPLSQSDCSISEDLLAQLCFNLNSSQCREFIDPPDEFIPIKESEFREIVLVTYQGFEPRIFICLGFVYCPFVFQGIAEFSIIRLSPIKQTPTHLNHHLQLPKVLPLGFTLS